MKPTGLYAIETEPDDRSRGIITVVQTEREVEAILRKLKQAGIRAKGWEL